MNYQSNHRRHEVHRVQQDFQKKSFDHIDNLETLEMCVSNLIQYAL